MRDPEARPTGSVTSPTTTSHGSTGAPAACAGPTVRPPASRALSGRAATRRGVSRPNRPVVPMARVPEMVTAAMPSEMTPSSDA